jgi:DeoR/GlpR family transcriptional regulator of sugar metabolism
MLCFVIYYGFLTTNTILYMKAEQRLRKIGDMLQSGEEVTIPEMAVRFAVSEMTIRRDLDKLAESGLVRRTHGGAVSTEKMAFEFDFAARRQSNHAVKCSIASAAADYIKAGQRIILDTGTTTLELAHILKERTDLTVITPSLAVASELQFSDGVQAILLGGAVRKGRPDLTGIVAEAVLDMFSADIAFQGADGIGLDGALYTADMQVAAVDKKIRSRAKKTYVLADSSKIGETALTRHGFLHEVAGLITDSGISDRDKKRFEKLGAKVLVVNSE